MTLSLEPDKVIEEVRANYRERDRHLEGVQLILDKYPGRWWSEGGVSNPSTSVDGEASAFEYVSFAMTQGVWANPRWRCTTRRPRAQQMIAEAMHWGMNRWTQDSDLKTTLEDLFVDYCFSWGVAHVSAVPLPETYEAEDPQLWPQLSRISPWDFGMDRTAPSARRARLLHHRYRIDKSDLLERARADRERPRDQREGWNLGAIRELQETTVAESWLTRNRKGSRGAPWAAGVDEPDREQVEVLEVYFPGHRLKGAPGPEDGFNGTLATYGLPGGGDTAPIELRKPRPFFGPRWGPYTVIGCYIVPDSPWPLSLLAATAGQQEQASRIANAVDAQVAAYKRLGLTNDPILAQMVKDRPTDTIHVYRHLPNLDNAFRDFETGGTTAANVAAEQRVIARRDRVMGFSQNQRGVTTGDTATDVTFANEAAMGRQGYVRNRYQDGIRRAGRTVAWYLYHTDEIVMPLGLEAIEAFGLEEGEEAWFVGGGTHEDGSGTTFDDLGLELEPYSMERPSEGLLQKHGELLANVMQMAPAFPVLAQTGADVKGLLDAYGDAYGFPRLSRYWPGIDSVDLAAMQPAEIEPRLGRDVGIHGLLKSFAPKGGVSGSARGAPAPAEFSPQTAAG